MKGIPCTQTSPQEKGGILRFVKKKINARMLTLRHNASVSIAGVHPNAPFLSSYIHKHDSMKDWAPDWPIITDVRKVDRWHLPTLRRKLVDVSNQVESFNESVLQRPKRCLHMWGTVVGMFSELLGNDDEELFLDCFTTLWKLWTGGAV